MYKKELTFKDYDGKQRTETLLFHLNEVELVDIEVDKGPKGMLGYLENIQKTENTAEAVRFIKDLLRKSYGIKSDDGRQFIKSDAIWDDFSQTAAYPAMFALLVQSEVELEAFITGLPPAESRAMPLIKNVEITSELST